METLAELLRQGQTQEVWRRCCGFVDLSLQEFMEIQERLLLEQLELLNNCALGEKLMNGRKPRTVQEFREVAPLTTYSDYVPELLERREEVLPAKPLLWQRTSGRSGEYPCKWVPVTPEYNRQYGLAVVGTFILASCEERGDVRLEPNDTALYGVAPPPFSTGATIQAAADTFPLRFLPPIKEAVKLGFQERMQKGFLQGFDLGMDYCFGMSSILVAMGERISRESRSTSLSTLLSHPRTLWRFATAWAKTRLTGEAIMPKHLWSVKGLAGGGADSSVLREKVKALWGRYFLEVYGSTESGAFATQTWDYGDMTFFPNLSFLEFIPEADALRSRSDPGYHPRTLLLDEVKAGECYEIVMTSLHGGALVRYRMGDLVRITALRNEALGIDTPQMRYESRVDGIIDLASFSRLTEITIWKALEDSGIGYMDWSARKEVVDGEPVLQLYLELRPGESRGADEITPVLEERLKATDSDYRDMETMLGRRPLRVAILPDGAFARYTAAQQAAGAEIAWLKVPHINPPAPVVDLLLTVASEKVA